MLKIYKKFFNFSGEQKKNFYQAIFLGVIRALFEAMQIMAVAVVLIAILANDVTQKTVWMSFGIMLFSIVGSILIYNSMTMKQTIGGYSVCANKRIEVGDHLKYVPMGYFNQRNLGSIISVTTNVIGNLQEVATRVIMLTLQGLITSAVIAVCITIYDYRIGLIMLVGIGLFILVNSMMQKKAQKIAPRKIESDTKLVEKILEFIQGISVVKSYNLGNERGQQIYQAIEEDQRVNYKMEKILIPFISLQTFVLKTTSTIILIAAIYFYVNDTMSLISCLLMIVSAFMVYSQLENAGSFSSLLRIVDLSVDRVEEIFAVEKMDIDGKDIPLKKADIVAENVSFKYDKQEILKNISFVIPENTTTAFVGPSGSGKTTICNLITRFFDVTSGSIQVNGHDVKEYNLDSLLQNISMVFQDVYLFNDTIKNNIRFGTEGASQDDIIAAAQKACCHEFIINLPDGYDTIIGEGGASISGGEQQRLSIARAMLKDAPIIILDEATANIDPENETLIQQAIDELTKNKTIIMIAHKLKTVRNADQIIVIDEGEIKQIGKHQELLDEGGLYQRFIEAREQSLGWKL